MYTQNARGGSRGEEGAKRAGTLVPWGDVVQILQISGVISGVIWSTS